MYAILTYIRKKRWIKWNGVCVCLLSVGADFFIIFLSWFVDFYYADMMHRKDFHWKLRCGTVTCTLSFNKCCFVFKKKIVFSVWSAGTRIWSRQNSCALVIIKFAKLIMPYEFHMQFSEGLNSSVRVWSPVRSLHVTGLYLVISMHLCTSTDDCSCVLRNGV